VRVGGKTNATEGGGSRAGGQTSPATLKGADEPRTMSDEIKIPTFAELLQKRMDELARLYAETHDEKINAELEALSRQLAGLPTH
jgi:hypothetical protein